MATFNTLPTFRCWSQPPFKISCKYSYPRLNYNNFVNSSAMLDFWKLLIDQYLLRLLIFYHGTKFGAKMLIAPKLWPKNEIQNGGRRHLEFTSGGYFWSVDLNHHTKFRDSSRRLTTVTFQNWRWRPSAILDFRNSAFWALRPLGLTIFHHCTKFGAKMMIDAQIIAQKRNSKWRPQPSWI